MTREEAIESLRGILTEAVEFENSVCYVTEEDREPLEMAIKALEPCEDVIDRAEAMTEIMMFAGNVKSDEEDIYIKVSDAVQLLRELPPVNSQPKTGRWIHFATSDDCSECGWSTGKYISPSKYCPNCGTKMSEIPTGSDPQEREEG